jgi:hypothetical protein
MVTATAGGRSGSASVSSPSLARAAHEVELLSVPPAGDLHVQQALRVLALPRQQSVERRRKVRTSRVGWGRWITHRPCRPSPVLVRSGSSHSVISGSKRCCKRRDPLPLRAYFVRIGCMHRQPTMWLESTVALRRGPPCMRPCMVHGTS